MTIALISTSGNELMISRKCTERAPGLPLAEHAREDARDVRPGEPRELPDLHQRRAGADARVAHHSAGHPRLGDQDHERAADGHVRQPSQVVGQLQPGWRT